MSCPEKQLLQDMVDGELEKSQVSDLKEHIKSCSKCKEQFLQILNILLLRLNNIVPEKSRNMI